MKKVTLIIAALCAFVINTRAVLPVNANAHGKSYGEWSAAWWQWAFSLPANGHPLFDETGADASAGQSGNVWFLGGVFNATGSAVREIEIPAGTALLFPIINAECSTVESDPWFGSNESELRECVEGHISSYSNLSLEIDGESVSNLDQFNVISPLVSMNLPEGNILGVPAGPVQFVSGGIYVLIPPLSVGEHTIHFTGFSDVDNFGVDITYNVSVAPRKNRH
jgi:hypothetical protein